MTGIYDEMSSPSSRPAAAFCLPMELGTKHSRVAPPRLTSTSPPKLHTRFLFKRGRNSVPSFGFLLHREFGAERWGSPHQVERVQCAPSERAQRGSKDTATRTPEEIA